MIEDCCLILLTVLFPPAGVLLISGCGFDLVISLCLTFLGFLPGLVHGIYVIMTRNKEQKQYMPLSHERPQHGSQMYTQPPPRLVYNQPLPPIQAQKASPPTRNDNPPPYSK